MGVRKNAIRSRSLYWQQFVLTASLVLLTLVLLVCNFLSVLGSEALGNVLHYMLIILSTPMVCCGAWGLSLFLWACLLFTAQKQLKN